MILIIGLANATSGMDINATVDRNETAFEQPLKLILSVQWNENDFLPQDSAPRVDYTRMRLLGIDQKLEVLGGGEFLQTYTYTFEPASSGTARIEPFQYSYITLPDSLQASYTSEQFAVSIAFPNPNAETSDATLWIWIGVLLLLLLGAGAFILLRRGDEKKTEKPEVTALKNRLALLKARTANRRADFYHMLYDLLYDLLHERNIVDCRRGDSDAFTEQTKNSTLEPGVRDQIVGWISQSARNKYAPDAGEPGEALRVYYEVENFLLERLDQLNPAEQKTDIDSKSGTKSAVITQ